jgi:hypothetical protein
MIPNSENKSEEEYLKFNVIKYKKHYGKNKLAKKAVFRFSLSACTEQ